MPPPATSKGTPWDRLLLAEPKMLTPDVAKGRPARIGPSVERATRTDALILVVDDTEMNRSLARQTLEREGYRVVLASGGAEGIAAFEREHPDCVLLDVRMPDIDGFAVCERIRALPRGSAIPIVFLTADRDAATFDRALRAGGDDFLTKPVRPTELVVRVQTALKLRDARTELAEHHELLKRQRDDLMRLHLQKERLMALVVHDLKNPLNALDLHAQLLLRERDLPPSARSSVTQIRAQARQLNRMIMNLLDLAEGDQGKLSPQRAPVEVNSLVAEVVEELALNALGHNVNLKTSVESLRLDVDGDLLRRILENLVENAIRHAPRGSTVGVAGASRGAGFEFRITDTGTGIPSDMRGRIFEAFVQLDGEGRPSTRGGQGLGLAFCKLAAEAHEGRIWVEDAGPGAVFCVWLPLVCQAPPGGVPSS